MENQAFVHSFIITYLDKVGDVFKLPESLDRLVICLKEKLLVSECILNSNYLNSLQSIDYNKTRENLINYISIGKKDAESKGQLFCLKKEVMEAAVKFCEIPDDQNLSNLLKAYPSFNCLIEHI
jgi:hypothetical protein